MNFNFFFVLFSVVGGMRMPLTTKQTQKKLAVVGIPKIHAIEDVTDGYGRLRQA